MINLSHSEEENTDISQEEEIACIMPSESEENIVDQPFNLGVVFKAFLHIFTPLVEFCCYFEEYVN